MTSNKSRAEYFRKRRARLREERNRGVTPATPATRVAPVAPKAATVAARAPQQPQPTRRRRMKSDQEIRAHVIMTLRQHGQNPAALVHLLTGYIRELQDLMKRDREDELAEKACEHRHPGRLAQGVYCRMCHDAEMSGKFGSLPGTPHPSGDLVFPGDESEVADEDLDSLMLDGIKIKTDGVE